jgi:hypothetical protein
MPPKDTSRRKKRRLSVRGLAVLLMLFAVLVAAVVFGLSRIKGSPKDRLIELPFAAGAEYGFTDRGIMTIGGEKLIYCTQNGEMEWELPLTIASCKLATGGNYAVLYTQNVVQAISESGAALFPSLEFSGRVLSVRCGEKVIAVLKEEDDASRFIYLYDLAGTRLDKLELKTNTLLNYGFDDSRGFLWTLMINTEASLPVCTVSTYNVDTHSDTGAMTKEGQLIERVYFSDSKTYACGTNHLIVYGSTGKEESSALIYGWKVLDFLPGKAPMALLALRQESNAVSVAAKVLSIDSGEEYKFRLPANTLGAYFYSGKIAIVLPNKLVYYSLKGEYLSETLLLETANAAALQKGRIVLTCGDKLFLLP